MLMPSYLEAEACFATNAPTRRAIRIGWWVMVEMCVGKDMTPNYGLEGVAVMLDRLIPGVVPLYASRAMIARDVQAFASTRA